MMGVSHAATGLFTGAMVGYWIGQRPEAMFVCAAVGAGAALLPDLDEPRSRVGRSLGAVTELVSGKLREASRQAYRRTATEVELRKPQDGGHRHLTHTVPACVAFGLVALMLSLLPLGAALLVLSMSALGLGTAVLKLKKDWGTQKQRRQVVLGVSILLAMYAYLGADAAPPAWLLGLTVFVGALTHVLGDWLTKSGVPLAWPFVVRGKRWWMFRSPVAFRTEDRSPVEAGIRVASLAGIPLVMLLSTPMPPPA